MIETLANGYSFESTQRKKEKRRTERKKERKKKNKDSLDCKVIVNYAWCVLPFYTVEKMAFYFSSNASH